VKSSGYLLFILFWGAALAKVGLKVLQPQSGQTISSPKIKLVFQTSPVEAKVFINGEPAGDYYYIPNESGEYSLLFTAAYHGETTYSSIKVQYVRPPEKIILKIEVPQVGDRVSDSFIFLRGQTNAEEIWFQKQAISLAQSRIDFRYPLKPADLMQNKVIVQAKLGDETLMREIEVSWDLTSPRLNTQIPQLIPKTLPETAPLPFIEFKIFDETPHDRFQVHALINGQENTNFPGDPQSVRISLEEGTQEIECYVLDWAKNKSNMVQGKVYYQESSHRPEIRLIQPSQDRSSINELDFTLEFSIDHLPTNPAEALEQIQITLNGKMVNTLKGKDLTDNQFTQDLELRAGSNTIQIAVKGKNNQLTVKDLLIEAR